MDEQVPTPPAPPEMPEVKAPTNDSSGKILAALGYLVWVVALIALLIEPYKNDKFVRFHALQALVLGIAVSVLATIPVLGWLVAMVGYVYLIYLAIKAWSGEMIKIPVIHDLVKGYI